MIEMQEKENIIETEEGMYKKMYFMENHQLSHVIGCLEKIIELASDKQNYKENFDTIRRFALNEIINIKSAQRNAENIYIVFNE